MGVSFTITQIKHTINNTNHKAYRNAVHHDAPMCWVVG